MKTLLGSVVALVTPMTANHSVDWAALEKLVQWHIDEGTDGIVAVGTTGESATLNVEEHARVIEAVVAQAAGRISVIAGAGANATDEAVALSQRAEQLGADALLSVVPYYNKPNQAGLYRHFETIARAVKLPVILYNVPGRTVADLANSTALELAQIDNIVGIKDATGDLARGTELINQAPAGFAIYSGDDATGLPLLLLGAHGVISVTANVAPRAMSQMVKAATGGDITLARALNRRLWPLHRTLFVEPSPAPTKWALARMGKIGAALRLPLVELSAAAQAQMEQALIAAELL